MIANGTKVAKDVKDCVKESLRALSKVPTLAVILVGDNSASKVYVRNKAKDCEECGIKMELYDLREDISEKVVLRLIKQLNQDDNITGILVQMPLPKHINTQKVIECISPKKDVDCFHPINVGYMVAGNPQFLPCTPTGVIELIDSYGIQIAGKHCVVLGRSNIVGKPMATLLTQRDATVTLCHSKTTNLKDIASSADILISAVGKRNFVTADMVKDRAVVIDVGINRDENGKLCGDVDFAAVSEKSSFITPVPGGIGPMTRAMLMKNVWRAAKNAV